MDLGKLSRGERIIAIAGVLLVIDLLFLPWHSISVPYIGSVDRNGISGTVRRGEARLLCGPGAGERERPFA